MTTATILIISFMHAPPSHVLLLYCAVLPNDYHKARYMSVVLTIASMSLEGVVAVIAGSEVVEMLQGRRNNSSNVTVIILTGVTIKIFPGPDFPGARGVLIA